MSDATGMEMVRGRIRGALLGTAVGDALGAPLEFLDGASIVREYGPGGLVRPEPWNGHPAGSYTDDTQMTIATARGLLKAERAAAAGEAYDAAGAVLAEYLRWYEDQADPALRRAPGATCLSALAAARAGHPARAANRSKGCGGVMRIAPVGLVPSRRDAFDLGCDLAVLTHGHPTGYLAAGFLAELVARLVRGDDPAAAVRGCETTLKTRRGHEETLLAVGHALRLVAQGAPIDEGIRALGAGWVAEEALAIALFCWLRVPGDWPSAVLSAANHGGDSDSTAAIAGALAGVDLGVGAIPPEWVAGVEDGELIRELADDLWRLHEPGAGAPCA